MFNLEQNKWWIVAIIIIIILYILYMNGNNNNADKRPEINEIIIIAYDCQLEDDTDPENPGQKKYCQNIGDYGKIEVDKLGERVETGYRNKYNKNINSYMKISYVPNVYEKRFDHIRY